MSLRDLLVTALVFGALPVILRRPYVGILVWSWLSYMNPHRLTWGFAYSMPFAQIVALTIFAALALSKGKNQTSKIPTNALTVTWIWFLIWISITTIFAFEQKWAVEVLISVAKIQLIVFLTITLIDDRIKIDQLLWVIVLSIGFFTVKGGVFTLVNAGSFRVWGPPLSFIEDNNALAVATVMLIPLMFYLRSTLTNKWARLAMTAAIALSAVSAAGSYSRSAFVAGAATTFFLVAKSRRRAPIFIAMVLLVPFILAFMPQSWHDRMATITNPTQEASANNRLEAWATAINVANNHITGGGFDLWSRAVYAYYGPTWMTSNASGRNAHSIYFNVLAEHGWIGLFLFLLVFFLAWRQAAWVSKRAALSPDLEWAGLLARMLQVSLVAYASGGATLTLAYFDLPWHIVAFTLILRRHVESLGMQGALAGHPNLRHDALMRNAGGAPGPTVAAGAGTREHGPPGLVSQGRSVQVPGTPTRR